VVLARLWGPDRYGWFNYLFVIITLSGVVADFGLDVLLTRSVASGIKGIPRALLHLKFATVFGSLAIFGVFAMCFSDGLVKPFLLLLIGGMLFSSTNFLNGFLRGIDRLDLEAKVGLVQKCTFVLGSIWGAWFLNYGLLWVTLCYLSTHVLGFFLTWRVILPYRPLILKDALPQD
jgi:O-antigen/teichoic acid export membrane protein